MFTNGLLFTVLTRALNENVSHICLRQRIIVVNKVYLKN